MEYVVTLHGENDVVTAFPCDQQDKAVELWKQYVADGTALSLTLVFDSKRW